MNASESNPPALEVGVAKTSAGAMIRTLGLVAMISGFLVVLANELTAPAIEANRQAMIAKAVFKVLPGAVSRRTFTLTPGGLKPGAGDGRVVYAGYDAKGQLVGVAAEGAAQGYADMVRLLYGYDPRCQCIVGMRIIKMAETPGLGDRAASDPDFLANFKALAAKVAAGGKVLANAIVTVKHGSKHHPWQIDAISGATITSRAVGRAIDGSAETVVPTLVAHLGELKQGAAP